ncbi:MAG: anti-sigma factor [Silvibacterium sp.]
MSSTQHISQEDLTLYSIQALTPAEYAEARAHLGTCADCRSALADVLADLSLIGLSVQQKAIPDGARQRFLATVANTPQASTSTAGATPAARTIPEQRHKGGLGWFGWVTAIAAIAVACYLGYHSFDLQQQLDANRGQIAQLSAQAAHAQELMDALTSPQAKQVTLTETKQPAQPVGHATYLQKSGALIFVASNLHPVPQNKTYELWLIPANGKAPIPAGLFRPDSTGSASVVLPPLPAGVDAKAFGVTVEEAQGSATPTLPIVMAGQ